MTDSPRNSEQQQRGGVERRHGLVPWPTWPVLVVILYVGSVGPISGLQQAGIIPGSPAYLLSHPVYLPLKWFSEFSETFRLYLLRYMVLFTGRW